MSDEQSLIDEAWRRIPQEQKQASPGRFTRARFERIAQVLVAVAGAVLGGQTLVIAVMDGQFQAHPVVLGITMSALAAMIVTAAVGRFARIAAGVFAVVYVAALAWWCFVDIGGVDPIAQPWPFFLLSVATGAALVAFSLPWQIAWAVVPPILFGIAQLLRAGFVETAWEALGYDTSIAILLNLLIIVLGWMYRGIADGVDEARGRVVEAYTGARVVEAAERERIEIASLMHDSVLAALIAAARAESPRERRLVVDMSREALTRLANAETAGPEGSDAPREAGEMAAAIEHAASELGVTLAAPVHVPDGDVEIPGRVARAMVLAAKQAVANAVHHADAVGLAASVSADSAGVSVEVSDGGPGLDVSTIPADRLGIRASIMARLAAVGGEAHIDSGPHGTRVTLAWSASDEEEGNAT